MSERLISIATVSMLANNYDHKKEKEREASVPTSVLANSGSFISRLQYVLLRLTLTLRRI